MRLEGKRIVVTGAGRGIGRAIASACAAEGAVVGINYRESEESARRLAAELAASGAEPVLLPFDVRDTAAIEAAVETFSMGDATIDGWVNNAGINRPGLLVAAHDEALRELLDVNLLGPILCTRAVLPVMMTHRSGVIINISSVAAIRPYRGNATYAATKGALEAFTRAVAVEYGRKGIRCHCLRPGPIETDMLAASMELAGGQPDSRLKIGKPADVAQLAVHLLSDASDFITGDTHTIDGGFLLG